MATAAADRWAYPRRLRDPLLAAAGLLLLPIMTALGRHFTHPGVPLGPWLTVHLCAIVPAVPIGAIMLLRRKGDRTHRLIGRVWAALMVVAAISSFGVTRLMGHLSPIHLLSILTLISVPRAIVAARAGRIEAHRRGMTILYAALLIAGYFTLLPTRVLGHWLFG
jgi:uncharacterized membrane protein